MQTPGMTKSENTRLHNFISNETLSTLTHTERDKGRRDALRFPPNFSTYESYALRMPKATTTKFFDIYFSYRLKQR